MDALSPCLEHGNVSEIALDFVILHRVEALSLAKLPAEKGMEGRNQHVDATMTKH